MPAFRSPQVVLLVEDPQRSAAFYGLLGFQEVFRTPSDGASPIHIDVLLDGVRLGLAARSSVERDHCLTAAVGPGRAAVVAWTDVPAALAALAGAGVEVLREPSRWLDRLLIAWVADPDGHPVQLVQEA